MTPYFQADGITLYHGDCREIRPTLGLRFDAAITDPPYGETSLEWDVWPEGWPALASSVTNSLWCFGSMRMFLEQRDEFEAWKFAQDVIWEKQNGSGFAADRFKRVHECATHWYLGEWGNIHHSPPLLPGVSRSYRRNAQPTHTGTIGAQASSKIRSDRIQRSVIFSPNCHGFAVNETQKPEGIIAPLMSYSVPPGGSVVDFFAGSGTVLAVARLQGKTAVGFEKRESQCQNIVKRLAQMELLTA